MFLGDSDGGDVCVAVLVVMAVLWCGNALTGNQPRLRQFGLYAGAGTFAIVVTRQLLSAPSPGSAEVFMLIVRGLAIGALAMGLGWCAAAPIVGVYDATVTPLIRYARERRIRRDERKTAADEARRARVEEERRRQEYERGAPERERQERLRAERQREDAQAQKRRDDELATCLLYFNRFETDLSDRFTRLLFESFTHTYMTDRQSPEEVEQRGKQLRQMIDDLLAVVLPAKFKKPQTIEELSQWYLTQREHIESLSLDEELMQTHLANLDARYMELTQNVFERAQP